jgi:hypothetical protein
VFDPDSIDRNLWAVLALLGGDVERTEEAVKDLNRGSLTRVGWALELAIEALVGPPYQPEEREYEDARLLALWVVTRGEGYFRAVLADPGKMPVNPPLDPMLALPGALMETFWRRFGTSMPPLPHDYRLP